MLNAAPGEWYISVLCKHCLRRILLFYDLSKGKSELRESKLKIICPNCNIEGSYQAEHYQVPNADPKEHDNLL